MFKFCFSFLLFLGIIDFSRAQSTRATLLQEFNELDSICIALEDENLALVLKNSRRMQQIGQEMQLDSCILIANLKQAKALGSLGSFEAALKKFYETLALAEKTADCFIKFKALYGIGRVYQSMSDYPNMLIYTKKSKESSIFCQKYADTVAINYEIGFALVESGQQKEGIDMVRNNLAAARLTKNAEDIVLGIDNLSNLLAETGAYQEALDVEMELLKMPELWPTALYKTGIYDHLAEISVKLKNWDDAQKYQKESFKYAKILNSNDWLFECYKVQAQIDEARGNFKSALQNHKMYLLLKDSVYQTQYDEKMASMNAAYELDSKEKAISILEKDRQIQEDKLRQQEILIVVGLLLAIIGFLVNHFLNQRKTQKMREFFAQELIKTQENERRHISQELHDSVGQNILFIKNRIQRIAATPDVQLVQSVDAALEEVRNIAKNLYPNQLEQYGLSSAVDALCETVQQSSGIFVSSDLQNIDAHLNREAKINCYRIIQECINNTIKHAGATAIRITSSFQSGNVELVVQDNGCGFDRNILEKKANRSFGMINMEQRIRMLRGKFDLETTQNKGVKLTFAIPV